MRSTLPHTTVLQCVIDRLNNFPHQLFNNKKAIVKSWAYFARGRKKSMATEIAFCGMGQKNQLFQKLYLVEWDKTKQCENQLQKLVGRKTANYKMNGNIQRSKEKKTIVTNVNCKSSG